MTILAALGFRMRAKARTLTSLDVVIAATIFGYWIGVSLFPDWTGGWSYGPRLLADVVPLMVWFLPPIFEALARSRNTVVIGLAALLVVLSVAIQARGAFVERTATWNWRASLLGPRTRLGLERSPVPRLNKITKTSPATRTLSFGALAEGVA